MVRGLLFVSASALSLLGCVHLARAPAPPPVVRADQPVSFLADIKPIMDSRCAVCHSCYNAACQLKLSSYEGIDRGGSKAAVYSSDRLKPQQPTRLFVDAQLTEQWRDLGFHSVTSNSGAGANNDSTMAYFLDAKRRNPVPSGRYQAEATDLTCAADQQETRAFLGRHPGRGMPFGFPALSSNEHDTLAAWLAQGAVGPTKAEQAALVNPGPADAAQIARWEAFLNRDDPKHAMTARYIYEHLFLAHVRFVAADSDAFFYLVRSATPPGEAIQEIATARPYDDPGEDRIYYRFRKIHATIVYKTHIVFELDDATLARYQELFIAPDWLQPPHLMPYDDAESANPFLVYAQIPPRSRYQFLLDNAEYIVRTFTRGPVCRGQIAVNVIQDHFWTLFLDPDSDETVKNPEFLIQQADNLRLPTEAGSDMRVLKSFSNKYRSRYADFYKAKNALYEEKVPGGLGIDAIWPGNRPSDAPVLTVYRHFDSASVLKGAIGDLPRTLWVIDYSQFERVYYALVAGFDVFGNISHQANVRRYMDYLRMEGELNFVSFLPPDDRVATFRSWYIGDRALKDTRQQELLTRRDTAVVYKSGDPKRELVEQVVNGRLDPAVGIAFDSLNYHADGEVVAMPETFNSRDDVVQGFRALNTPGTGFIRHVTNSEANVLYVRLRGAPGGDRFVSIVINRWHDNVNAMLGETLRLDPSKDNIDFIFGSVGAYPNYFLDVALADIPMFFDMLYNFDGSPEYVAKLNRFGVNRRDPRFWDTYDWFQNRFDESDPVNAGLYDLNRYYSRAFAD